MNELPFDIVYLTIGMPAVALGLFIGVLFTWLIGRSRNQRMIEERESAFELANAKLSQAFTEISNRSLQSNSDTFLKLAEQKLDTQQEKAKSDLSKREKAVEALVKPIQDALTASQKQISELEKTRSEAYGGIKNQLEAMQLSQISLKQETQNLVNALRRPEVRGRWGEITLRRLVELAGMWNIATLSSKFIRKAKEK